MTDGFKYIHILTLYGDTSVLLLVLLSQLFSLSQPMYYNYILRNTWCLYNFVDMFFFKLCYVVTRRMCFH